MGRVKVRARLIFRLRWKVKVREMGKVMVKVKGMVMVMFNVTQNFRSVI